jgi:aminotransferase
MAGATYGTREGLLALREAVSAWERVSLHQISITTGASLALAATLATLERPGTILCPRPYYPLYPRVLTLLGFDIAFYDLVPAAQWDINPDSLTRLLGPDTRGLIINAPGNPTGSIPTPSSLAVVAHAVANLPLLVISDEVYGDFIFDASAKVDMNSFFPEERLVRIKSFSKLLGIPGERVGYAIASQSTSQDIARAHWTLAMSPPATSQIIALQRLSGDMHSRVQVLMTQLATNLDEANRLLRASTRIRFSLPQGGIFLWLEIDSCNIDSRAFAEACTLLADVVVIPGAEFGIEAPVYVRASFGVEPRPLHAGLRALAHFVSTL